MAGKHFVLITTLGLGGCLGPNPLLNECGEKWVIEAVDAWSKHPDDWYWTRICAGHSEDERCIGARGEMCLTIAQANDLLTNPDSLVLETLQLEAITACKQIAVDKGAEMDTCATGLGEPFYAGRCKLSEELCFGDQTETSTDSGGTDSDGTDTSGTTDTGGVIEPLELLAR